MSVSTIQPLDLSQVVVTGGFAAATVDNRYAVIAERIESLAKLHPFFETDVTVGLADFIAPLDLPAQRMFNCRCCAEFFKRVGNLVYIDPTTGRPVSVFWRDYPTDNIEMRDVYNKIARKVETGVIIGVFDNLSVVGKYNRNNRIGVKQTGEWPHFYADFYQSMPKALANKHLSVVKSILVTYIRGSTPLDVAKAAKSLVLRAEGVTEFPKAHLQTLQNVAEMWQWLVDQLTLLHVDPTQPVNEMTIPVVVNAIHGAFAAQCRDGILIALYEMEHFNGSVLGNALKSLLDDVDGETVFNNYFRQIDPLKFRAREAQKATEQEIKQAKVLFEEEQCLPSFIHRFAHLGDLPVIWTPVVKEPAPVESDNPFDQALAAKAAPVKPTKEVFSEVKEITITKFRTEIVPKAVGMSIPYNRLGDYIYVFSVPVADDTPPVLVWDTPENHRREMTLVSQERVSYDAFDINVSSGYAEVVGFTTMPWTLADGKSLLPIANGRWALLVKGNDRHLNETRLNSMGGVLSSKFYGVRRALDLVFEKHFVQQNGEIITGFELKDGRVVHVEFEDCIRVYKLRDID